MRSRPRPAPAISTSQPAQLDKNAESAPSTQENTASMSWPTSSACASNIPASMGHRRPNSSIMTGSTSATSNSSRVSALARAGHALCGSRFAAGSGRALVRLQSAQQGFQVGAEALVAVAVPGVDAVGGQGREAAGGQGAEERVQLLSGRGVAQALFGGRGGIGEGEAEGVVVDTPEGQGGLAAGQTGREQRRDEC